MNRKILLIGSNGYVASKLYQKLKKKYDFCCIDSGLREIDCKANNFEQVDYRNLNEEYLSGFDECIWLAGHSNVLQSVADPMGCFENNLVGLVHFINKLPCRLIYASSGSVYNNPKGEEGFENSLLLNPLNVYDYTKFAFDNYLTTNIISDNHKKFIGLRFGTVVGSSSRIRPELLMNKMVLDSMRYGSVNLANPKAKRPVLFIDDLVNAIDLILEGDEHGEIYNLCSINLSMEEYAYSVSKFFNVPVDIQKNSKTYNFSMSTNKFTNKYGYIFQDDISVIINDIKNGYSKMNPNLLFKS